MSLLELFCDVDDFMVSFEPNWHAYQVQAGKQRERPGQLYPSEVMTILIHFHQSHYRTFKAYYTEHIQVYLTKEFPQLVSYSRFVALIPTMMVPLLAYLQSRFGACTGISFIDSTSLAVCDPKRISQHRVFAADAKRGKTSMGWFFGFKLHLPVNDRGDLLACCLTPATSMIGPLCLSWSSDCAASCLGSAATFPFPSRNCSLNRDFISSPGCAKT